MTDDSDVRSVLEAPRPAQLSPDVGGTRGAPGTTPPELMDALYASIMEVGGAAAAKAMQGARPEEVQDVANEVLLSALDEYRKDPRYFERRKLPGWVTITAQNLAKNHRLAKQREALRHESYTTAWNEEQLESTDPERALDREELRAALGRALQELDEQHQNVVIQVLLNDRSYKEAADVLGLKWTTVRTYLWSARISMTAALAHWAPANRRRR